MGTGHHYDNINFPGTGGAFTSPQVIETISVVGPTDLPVDAQDVGINNNANDVIIQLPTGELRLRTTLWCSGVGNDVILRPLAGEQIGSLGLGVDLTAMNFIGTLLLQGVSGGWQVISLISAAVALVLS